MALFQLIKTLKYYKTTAFLLGAVSVLALAPKFVVPILFISFGWLFYFLCKANSKKQAFLSGYFFGFGFFSFGLAWIGNALLVDASQTGFLYPIAFLSSGAFFGLFFAIPALIASYFKNVYHKFFVFVCSIVLFEWIKSWFLTGFPWNPIGSSFGFNQIFMQLASVGGIFFLSLVVLYIAILPTLYLITKNKKVFAYFMTLLLFVVGFGVCKTSDYKYEASEIKVRVVQPAIAQEMKWSKDALEKNLDEYIKMSQENNQDIGLVIWGETANPFALEFVPYYREKTALAIGDNAYLITGLLRYEFLDKSTYMPLNSMVVMDKNQNFINYYDKAHLVPFGEYIPFRKYLPESIKPVVNIIGEFKAGDGPKTIKLDNMPSFATSICYEIIFPNANIDRKNPPELLINLTNDGWYGKSFGPHQHLLTAQFRAVEEGLTTIRAANTGISAFILPTGEIKDSLGLSVNGVMDFYLPKTLKVATLYQLWQNYFILFIIGLTFFIVIIRRKNDGNNNC